MIVRSRFASLLAAFVIAACGAESTSAQSYPERPVRIIVPTPAGGPIDVVSRVLAHALSPLLGQNVYVDNRPGAGNTIGSREAAAAAPDGYTLLFSSASGLVISPMLYKSLEYDAAKSFTPVALISDGPIVLVVNPSVPAKSVAELIAYAKAHPGKLNFSSGGVGTVPHLTGELFKNKTGIDIVHVPYKGGGPSITDVVAGQVQMTFEATGVLLPLIRAGKLRALAVTSTKRNAELPDVPTMAESGYPEILAGTWTGLLAPAGTPKEIVARLNKEINVALSSSEVHQALAKLSTESLGGSPEDVSKRINGDVQKWGPIVSALGLRAN